MEKDDRCGDGGARGEEDRREERHDAFSPSLSPRAIRRTTRSAGSSVIVISY
jgi:hypothetical protein